MSHQKHLNPFYIDQGNTDSWEDYYDEDDDEEELGLLVGRGQYEPPQDRRNLQQYQHYSHPRQAQKLGRRRILLIGGLSILLLLVLLSLGGESHSETNPSPENQLKTNTEPTTSNTTTTTTTTTTTSLPTTIPPTNTNTIINTAQETESPVLPQEQDIPSDTSNTSHNQTQQPIDHNDPPNEPKVDPPTTAPTPTTTRIPEEPEDIDADLVHDTGTIQDVPDDDDDDQDSTPSLHPTNTTVP
jgi:hypothetical protein